MAPPTDSWDPSVYDRFRGERQKSALDLIDLLPEVAGGRAVDFGCGTGEITVLLHRRLRLAETVGVDSSAAMLARAPAGEPGVRFEFGDLLEATGPAPVDVVFANASLHWVPDHAEVLRRWTGLLRPGGWLAVQVPANPDHPSHTTSAALAAEEPWAAHLTGAARDPLHNVLGPETYAEILHDLGLVDQTVRLQVYGQVMAGPEEVVEWVSGTSLTRFRPHLTPEGYDGFVAEYGRRLADALGHRRPYFYAFKRILFVARRP